MSVNPFSYKTFALAPLLFLATASCTSDFEELAWEDLNSQERTYVERFVVLERARAVSFADLDRGTALLDSLAIAWGDTTNFGPGEVLPDNPRRLAAVHILLEQMLAAEEDSLLNAARADRLDDPLPDLVAVDAIPEP